VVVPAIWPCGLLCPPCCCTGGLGDFAILSAPLRLLPALGAVFHGRTSDRGDPHCVRGLARPGPDCDQLCA
jgi:hypothetical protein